MHEYDFGILDCTLRDGGYKNDWHFSQATAVSLIDKLVSNSIDAIEVGFLFPDQPKDKVLGRFAFISPEQLERLTCSTLEAASPPPFFGFMVNYSDFKELEFSEPFWRRFISPESKLEPFVRVATQVEELRGALTFGEHLQRIGFRVMLNIMQAHTLNDDLIEKSGLRLRNSPFDRIYLADSIGSMDPIEVRKKLEILHHTSGLPMGFHGHDNFGLALANSLSASQVHDGVWIDGTVTGIGRGAGNTKTENLVTMRTTTSERDSDANPKHFVDLCKFGNSNFASDKESDFREKVLMFSAKHFAHPNYALALLKEPDNSLEQNWDFLSSLDGQSKSRYQEHKIDLATSWYLDRSAHSYEEVDEKVDQFMLLGPGHSLVEYQSELQSFIHKRELRTGSLSANLPIEREFVTHYFICNPLHIIKNGIRDEFHSKVVSPWY